MSAPHRIDPALAAEVGVCPRCVQPGEHADDAACVAALVAAYEHLERPYADVEGEADDLFAALVEETARRLYAEGQFAGTTLICGTEGWEGAPAALRKQYRERATVLARAAARRRLDERARAATGGEG